MSSLPPESVQAAALPSHVPWAPYLLRMAPVWALMVNPLMYGVLRVTHSEAFSEAAAHPAADFEDASQEDFSALTEAADDHSPLGLRLAAGGMQKEASFKSPASLSAEGSRAIGYLCLAALAWALTGGMIPAVNLNPGVVGLALIILLHAPKPVGAADASRLKDNASFGFLVYLIALTSLNTAFRKTGLIRHVVAFLEPQLHMLHALPPSVQYCLVTWSISAATMVLGNVLAASAGAAFWFDLVTSASYRGPLDALSVALAVSAAGAICITPFQVPPILVGRSVYESASGQPIDSTRLHAFLRYVAVVELLVLVPLSSALIARTASVDIVWPPPAAGLSSGE